MKIPTITKPSDELKRHVKDANAFELPQKRTERSKTYKRGKNQYTLVIGNDRIHYIDDHGHVEEIDLSLKRKGKEYVCESAPYKVRVFTDSIGYAYESRNGGQVLVELLSINDEVVGQVFTVEVAGNILTWKDVRPGIDFVCALKTDGVELFKVIHTPEAPRIWVWHVSEEVGGFPTFIPQTRGVDATHGALKMETSVFDELVQGKFKTFKYRETWTGEVSRITDKALARRQRMWATDPVYPVTVDVTVTEGITTDTSDDGLERTLYSSWQGQPYSSYSVNIWGFPNPGGGKWHGGVRFQTVDVPQAATINSATLAFVVDSVVGTPQTKVYGDDVDDASAFSAGSRPSGITKTTATTNWNETGSGTKTVTITSIVQELVDRAGWVANNDMRFAVLVQNAASNHRVLVWDRKGGTTNDPTLTIDYTAAATDSYSGRGVGRGIGRGVMR